MELTEVIRRRRMVRSFSDRPLPAGLAARLLEEALRAPTAGNTGGTAWVLLEGSPQTAGFWGATTTEDWRERSRRWQGLSRAPVIAVSVASPEAYVERYGEPDKAASGLGAPGDGAGSGLGGAAAAWPVPYWFADAAFCVMTLLLEATAAGLGGCFLGNFRGERGLLETLGVPDVWRFFGAVALGYPDGADHASPSLGRLRAPRPTRVHHGRW